MRAPQITAFVVGFLLAAGATVAMPTLSSSGGASAPPGYSFVTCDPNVTSGCSLKATTFTGKISPGVGMVPGATSVELNGDTYLTWTGTTALVRGLTTGDLNLGGDRITINTRLLASNTAPVIFSGFGTSPSISASNGSLAFTIAIGTGGVASSGILTMPNAGSAWAIHCQNGNANATATYTAITSTGGTSVTLTNFSRTTGTATAWTAGEAVRCIAFPQ